MHHSQTSIWAVLQKPTEPPTTDALAEPAPYSSSGPIPTPELLRYRTYTHTHTPFNLVHTDALTHHLCTPVILVLTCVSLPRSLSFYIEVGSCIQ